VYQHDDGVVEIEEEEGGEKEEEGGEKEEEEDQALVATQHRMY
jgi:hypothetical protein